MYTTGVVLAAGASQRLGQPKQLLAYGDGTILSTTLGVVQRCGFDQIIVTLGGASQPIRDAVDLEGVDVIENHEYTTGCSSSISAALEAVDPRSDGIVLLLGDQPDVTPHIVQTFVEGVANSLLGVCRYSDGRGHPFWFSREIFTELATLHGDKAVWRILESGRYDVSEVAQNGPVPLDVDTWDDYERLLAQHGQRLRT
jgi:molybdenum cofactor cytidylyltransferase